jgi:hypothetical protein
MTQTNIPGEYIAGYFIRDAEIVHPARPIAKSEIEEIASLHDSGFCIQSAIEIGQRLKYWRDLIADGKWQIWLEQNLPSLISDATDFILLFEEFGTSIRRIGLRGQPEFLKDGFGFVKVDSPGTSLRFLRWILKDKREKAEKSEKIAPFRNCPDCKKAKLQPRQRYCSKCAERRRKETIRASVRLSRQGLVTVNS